MHSKSGDKTTPSSTSGIYQYRYCELMEKVPLPRSSNYKNIKQRQVGEKSVRFPMDAIKKKKPTIFLAKVPPVISREQNHQFRNEIKARKFLIRTLWAQPSRWGDPKLMVCGHPS
jgi:hypothetical protein